MDDELTKAFIATYYRLIYRDISLISQLYDPQAEIIRIIKSQKTKLRYNENVIPFDVKNTIVKINDFNNVAISEKSLISVMGCLNINEIHQNFLQHFILKQNDNEKYIIISDTFIDFEPPKIDLVCASTTAQVVDKVKRTVVREAPSTKRTTVDEFDPTKTITIINLSRNYIGNDVKELYKKFGVITKQFYTHNTIYLEYQTVQMAERVLKSKPPIYKGSYTKPIQGIVSKDAKVLK